MNSYKQLESRLKTLSDLKHIESIMNWDEATMMPIGGGDKRAEAMATLTGIHHEKLIDPQLLELVNLAKQDNTLSNWETRNLYWIDKIVRNAHALPTELVKKKAQRAVQSEQAWRRFRAENNWQDFLPYLENTFSLVKEAAQIRADLFKTNAYDICIDDHCPDLSQQSIDPIFNALKKELPSLVQQILSQKKPTPHQAQGPFSIEEQKALAKKLMATIGFDFEHGRLDTSHHPFCGGVPEDVRITTRYNEENFSSAMLGVCHESGHALYEQALPLEWRDQPVGQAMGMAVHESQSLIIEMDACRSKSFMTFFSKILKNSFGDQPALDPENLYQLNTQVEPSLIRVDADEVTYPLHVILRYEIERDLFSGAIEIKDLPEVWDAKMTEYLGLSTKGNDKDGVMQDVHWPSGAFGYFPAYTLGRLIAAQLFHFACKEKPEIPTQLEQGNFSELKQWLNQSIHSKGSLLTYEQLLNSATNEPLNIQYFLKHINEKYLA